MRLLFTDTDSVMVQIFELQDALHAMAEANLNGATLFNVEVQGPREGPERSRQRRAKAIITADCYSIAVADAALATALLAYYTSAQVDALLVDYRTGAAQDAETTIVREAHDYLQRQGFLRNSELAGQEAVGAMAACACVSCALAVRLSANRASTCAEV